MQFTTILQNAHLAGMDTMKNVIELAIVSLRQRSYDVLDLRDPSFDRDYLDFVGFVNELKVTLQVDTELLPISNTRA